MLNENENGDITTTIATATEVLVITPTSPITITRNEAKWGQQLLYKSWNEKSSWVRKWKTHKYTEKIIVLYKLFGEYTQCNWVYNTIYGMEME